jgi:hypothetical protein
MRRALLVAGCIVLTALAGCGGVFGTATDGADTATPTDTVDDPVTTSVTPTPENPLAAPPAGLSPDNITSATQLAAQHREALDDRNVTVRIRHRLTAENGTLLVDETEVRRVSADRDWLATRTFDGTYARYFGNPAERAETYYNGSTVFARIRANGETSYFVDDGVSRTGPVDYPQLLRSYTRAQDVNVSAVDGSIQLRFTAPFETRLTAVSPVVNGTEASMTVHLTRSGRVTSYRTEYTGRLVNSPETTVRTNRTVRFEAIGETSVERPEWVSTARNATNRSAEAPTARV